MKAMPVSDSTKNKDAMEQKVRLAKSKLEARVMNQWRMTLPNHRALRKDLQERITNARAAVVLKKSNDEEKKRQKLMEVQDEYTKMNLNELKEACTAKSLLKSGTKAELQARLRAPPLQVEPVIAAGFLPLIATAPKAKASASKAKASASKTTPAKAPASKTKASASKTKVLVLPQVAASKTKVIIQADSKVYNTKKR